MSDSPITKYIPPGGNIYASSCVSNVIGFPVNRPVEPFTHICSYCRGVLTGQEKECPGCGSRRRE